MDKEVKKVKKSVLVIDTPEKCKECILSDVNLYDLTIKCTASGSMAVYNELCDDELLKTCPLHPLPQREKCNYYDFNNFPNARNRGFNDCLDLITGKKLGSIQ